MTATQFLALLEQKHLLPEKVLARLRDQVTKSSKPVTAKSVAKLLIDKGHLTAFQAQQLIGGSSIQTTPARSKPARTSQDARAPSVPQDETQGLTLVDEELDLAKVDQDKPREAPNQPESSSDSAAKPSESAAPTSSLWDEEFGLGDETPGDPLDDLLGDPSLADPSFTAQGSPLMPSKKGWVRRLFGRGKPKAVKKSGPKNAWESPLILGGGGLLVFLVLLGIAVWFMYRRDVGDRSLKLAEEDYRGGSYTQSIHKYNDFLANYPKHPDASLARVRRGLARLRQATEGTRDFVAALAVAKEVLKEIENEERFPLARDELRSLLPTIAEGLAERSRDSEIVAQREAAVQSAEEAVALVANTKYVLRSHRPTERLQTIEDTLAVVKRDLRRDSELETALADIRTAMTSGNTAEAYAVRRKLLKSYPDLKEDAALAAATLEIAGAEAANVQTVEQRRPALSEEPASPVIATLAIANRRGEQAEGVEGEVVVVRVRGAAYGLEASTGRMLWRRWVGLEPDAVPVPVDQTAGSDVLLADSARDELLRVQSTTGKLVWRLPLEERFISPVDLGGRVLIATRSGKLHSVEPQSGESTHHALLPQGLRVPPAVHPQQPCIYQIGEHSNIYVFSSEDLKCKRVFYLGHETGTVRVPPVVVLRNVLVAENWGTQDATLHVLATDVDGLSLKEVQQIRLTGHVVTRPIVVGRRVFVATNRGQIKVFEVGLGSEENPLKEVAQRVADEASPSVRQMLVENDRLWVADTQLARYAVQTSGGRLIPQAIDARDDGDAFDGPLQRKGNVLFHVRRRANQPGVTVSAVETNQGRRRWTIDLAVPTVGEPIVREREIGVVTAAGAVFQFDAAAINARVQDQPAVAGETDGESLVLTTQVELDNGRYAYAPEAGHRRVLIHDRNSADKPLRWLELPGELTCAPIGFAGGLLVPTKAGRVHLIEPSTGTNLALPFQPRLEPGAAISWRTPATSGPESREVVISDGATKVYRLSIQEQPQRHLQASAASEELADPVVSPVGVTGSAAYAVDADGKLLSFQLSDLAAGTPLDFGGRATWGPRRVGRHVLVASDHEELIALDEARQMAWRRPLAYGPLAGAPLATDHGFLLASADGVVWLVSADSGEEIDKVQVGQPLAGGPTNFGSHVVVTGHDGTLLVIKSLPAQ